MKQDKKIGLGSISLLLYIFGILFSISLGNRVPIGDSILRFLGLSPWSNGDTGLHYTILYSLIFYTLALILGYKFKNDLGAKLGRVLALTTIIILLIILFAFTSLTVPTLEGNVTEIIVPTGHVTDHSR